ncbi:MAG: hypothetical protein K8R53_02930 [Bacteroidales bacterium]|nr:hypothetical protein [Bacteroidales bacterium]
MALLSGLAMMEVIGFLVYIILLFKVINVLELNTQVVSGVEEVALAFIQTEI